MLSSLEHFFLVKAQLKIHLETCFSSPRLSLFALCLLFAWGGREAEAEFSPALGGKIRSNERFLYLGGSYIPTPIHASFSLNSLPWLGVDEQTGNFKTLSLQRWTWLKITQFTALICLTLWHWLLLFEVDARNIDGSTPLCDACASGNVECVKLLLSYGAKVNPPLYTASPLHEACMSGKSMC